MTRRENLLERLEAVNPVPDPSRIYEDIEMAERLHLAHREGEASRLTETDVTRMTRRTTGLRARRGVVIAAAVAAAILLAGTGMLVLDDRSTDVAAGSRSLEVTFEGSGVDARCTVNGPKEITAGSIEIVFRNQSDTPGTDFMDFARLDEGRTEQEVRDFVEGDFVGRPSWTTPVAQFDVVEQGVVSRNAAVTVQPGLHALVCGSNVAGGGIVPEFGVFGAMIEVVP